MKRTYLVSNIQWDTDDEDKESFEFLGFELPKETEVEIDTDENSGHVMDLIGDKLSEEYGFTHFGFDVEEKIN